SPCATMRSTPKRCDSVPRSWERTGRLQTWSGRSGRRREARPAQPDARAVLPREAGLLVARASRRAPRLPCRTLDRSVACGIGSHQLGHPENMAFHRLLQIGTGCILAEVGQYRVQCVDAMKVAVPPN